MSTAEQREQWRELAEGLFRNYQDDTAQAIKELLADVDRLTAERDAANAELAGYKRNAAYISSVIESEGKYIP